MFTNEYEVPNMTYYIITSFFFVSKIVNFKYFSVQNEAFNHINKSQKYLTLKEKSKTLIKTRHIIFRLIILILNFIMQNNLLLLPAE